MKQTLSFLLTLLAFTGFTQVNQIDVKKAVVRNTIIYQGDTLAIVAVGHAATYDTLFVTRGSVLDTLIVSSVRELDNLSDVVLTTPDASDMLILDDETMKWVNRPLIQVYGDMLDTVKKSAAPISGNFITVYSKDTTRAYSDFSTAVTAAGTGDVIELSNATFTESGTVTMPTGSTLKIYEGGLLSGTFTLIGDNTRLDAGLYKCFDDNVTILGTWIVDETFVDWFGADAGGDDEDAPLNSAADFARLTTGKTLVFQGDRSYAVSGTAVDISGLTIEGNGCTITSLLADIAIFHATGDTSVNYDLSQNAYSNNPYIRTDETTLTSSLSTGDLVKLKSNKSITNEYNFDCQGEIHRVKVVSNDWIIFDDFLFESFLLSDNARAIKLTPTTVIVRNVNFVKSTRDTYETIGIDLYYTDNSIIKNCSFVNMYVCGIQSHNSYNLLVDGCSFSSNDRYGLGYDVVVGGASMYNKIVNCQMSGARHAVTTSPYHYGKVWGLSVENCDIIKSEISYAVGTHPGCGSLFVSNCRIKAGIIPLIATTLDTLSYPQYSGAFDYAVGDTVQYSDGNYFICKVINGPSSSVISPAASNSTWWQVSANNTTGIYMDEGVLTVRDCYIEGFLDAINVHSNDDTFTASGYISNVTAKNCQNGIIVGESIDRLHVDGFTIDNDYFTGGYLLSESYSSDYMRNTSFNNLTAKNAFLIYFPNTLDLIDSVTTFNNCKVDLSLPYDVVTNYYPVHMKSGAQYDKIIFNNLVLHNVFSGMSIDAKQVIVNGMYANVYRKFFSNILCEGDYNLLKFTGNLKFRYASAVDYVFQEESSGASDTIKNYFLDLGIEAAGTGVNIAYGTYYLGTYLGNSTYSNAQLTCSQTPKTNILYNNVRGAARISDDLHCLADVSVADTIFGNHAMITTNVTVDGNIGIGKDAPSEKLWIYGSAPSIYLQDDDHASSYMRFYDQAGGIGNIRKYANTGTSYLYMDAVPSDGSSVGEIRLNRITSTSGVNGLRIYKGNGSTTVQHAFLNNANSFVCADNGNFGIGDATPSYKLEVNGDAYINTSATVGTFLKITPTADPPGSPSEGTIYADTDHHLYYWNGSSWVCLTD